MIKSHSPLIQIEILHCPYCGTRHIDKDDEIRNWSSSIHKTHLCLIQDEGCGRLFESKDKCVGA
jgi:hypothetical protein